MATIIEDTRNKTGKHGVKHQYWENNGTQIIRCALPFGDYMAAPKIVIDTKQDVSEIGNNMCGAVRERKRFTEECKKAKDAGCKLVFLIEDKRFNEICDLYGKEIYLHSGVMLSGDQLATAMHVMSMRYDCQFMFTDPNESGRVIEELLNDG